MNDLTRDRMNNLESEMSGVLGKTEQARALVKAVSDNYLYCFKNKLTKTDESMILYTYKTWRVLMMCLIDTLEEANEDLRKSFDCIQRIYDTL